MENIKIPTHIAIQMDGNRRWGRENKGDPFEGHVQGGETLKEIIKHCKKIGVKILTVYALSTENLKRSKEELALHFKLHKKYLKENILDSDEFVKDKTRFRVIGRKELLPKDEQELMNYNDLVSFLESIGMTPKEARDSFSNISEIIENKKGFIGDGIKIID